jgi:hypothetical protein
MKLQKLGGYASIILICFIVLIRGMAASLGIPFSIADMDPVEVMTNFEAYPVFMRIVPLLGIFGAIYIVLITLVLKERTQSNAPNLMRFAIIAATIGSMLELTGTMVSSSGMAAIAGAKDVSSYVLLNGIGEGINYARGIAWGLALLLTGIAAVKTRVLPKILSYIILICGIGHILIFAVQPAQVVVVLLPIIFVWLGIFLIRNPEPSLKN